MSEQPATPVNAAPIVDRRRFNWASLWTQIATRAVSRKFWLSFLSALTALVAWYNHQIDATQALTAVGAFLSVYVLGQSYVDGKTQEAIPNDLQKAIIASGIDKGVAAQMQPVLDQLAAHQGQVEALGTALQSLQRGDLVARDPLALSKAALSDASVEQRVQAAMSGKNVSIGPVPFGPPAPAPVAKDVAAPTETSGGDV